jgi:hypothetical protein
MPNTTQADQTVQATRRRQVVLGLLLSGIAIALAILWGIWSFFHSETGVLIVTSRPSGAEVVLNRRPTDLLTTAFLSDLPADSFLVSVRMDGYRPVPPTQGVTIQPRETTRVTFLLSPITRGDQRPLPTVAGTPHNWKWRTVSIRSIPEDAALVVDEKELGVRTPVSLLLEPGLHHLRAHWADGSRAYKNIMIDPETTVQELILRPVTYESYTKQLKDSLR